MKDKELFINYRGVKSVLLVGVLEGDGSNEFPYEVVEYVLHPTQDGKYKTYGKVITLTNAEESFIGSDKKPEK
jgi:hypothetical protein